MSSTPTDPKIPDPRTWEEDEDVRVLLLEGSDDELDNFLNIVREPADLAECLAIIPDPARRWHVFTRLEEDVASDVLAHLDDEDREPLLGTIPIAVLARLADNMQSDDAADLLGELPADRVTAVLEKFPDAEDREEVRRLLVYPEDTAGGIMQAELVSLAAENTVAEAVSEIRRHAEEVDDLYVVFVTDADRKPVGHVPLVSLVVTSDETPLSAIMERDIPSVAVTEDQEEVAKTFQKYDLVTAPVVDGAGRLIGRITIDDIVDVIEEEVEEDILKAVGAEETDVAASGSIFRISIARLPWLVTNMIGGLIAGWLITMFTETLTEAIALAAFIPVIMATGGNVGIQTSTVTIRGYATGRVRKDNVMNVLGREVAVGLVLGVICGAGVALAAMLLEGNPVLGLVVGLALLIGMIVAATIGGSLPTLFRIVGVDPAIAAGPVITTANDIVAILIYFLIATALINHLR